jgi:ATP-dependent DNA helicase DinG
LLIAQEAQWVYWAEKAEGGRIEITAAPLNVSQMLSDQIFNKEELETSIWMSATLATNGEDPFAFFKKEIGAPDRIIQERVSSPFDYQRQAVLYLPSRLPDPNTRDFSLAIADHIEEILQVSRGRAFLLFTSYAGMNSAFSALVDRLDFPLRYGKAEGLGCHFR